MIKSMTGFGSAEGEVMERSARVEIKTVNNRFREIMVRAPHFCAALEEPLKKLAQGRLNRGRVDIWIMIDDSRPGSSGLSLDLNLAREVATNLRQVQQELGLPGDITIEHLLHFEILGVSRITPDQEKIWADLSILAEAALEQLVNMRLAEGQALYGDLSKRMTQLSEKIVILKGLAASAPAVALSRLKIRLEELAETIIDPARLAQEAAILADKMDITEEITRFISHVQKFRDILNDGEPAGRRLEFLLQEMGREANTMGAKSQSLTITSVILDLKSELEKVREQVMNIE